MNNYFVILAAGKSKRFNKKIPKQFFNYRNKEIIDHSIEKSLNSKLFKKILIVSNNLKYFLRSDVRGLGNPRTSEVPPPPAEVCTVVERQSVHCRKFEECAGFRG